MHLQDSQILILFFVFHIILFSSFSVLKLNILTWRIITIILVLVEPYLILWLMGGGGPDNIGAGIGIMILYIVVGFPIYILSGIVYLIGKQLQK